MDNKTPYIQKAVLIDDRRIELYWNTQVRRADCEKNFLVKYAGEKRELFHWTSNMEWSYGTLYQKENMRTTLSLSEPVDVSCASKLTVQVTGEVEDLEDHPADYTRVYEVVYEPYYTTQICTNCGIVVKAGKTVQRSSVEKAAVIVDMMLEKLPQVAQELVRRQASVAVYGLKENAFDVPGHRMGYLLATRHIEGFGGEMTNPLSSISEANVIRLRSGRYATSYPHEMILVHEFGHAIHLVGMDGLEDKTLSNRVKECYQHAKDAGLWHDTYAISNHEEYFATLGTIWFNVMQEGVDGRWDGIRGPVNTRRELEEYDPQGYELMKDIYPYRLLPAPWDHNTDHYDINGNLRAFMQTYDLGPDKFDWDFIK